MLLKENWKLSHGLSIMAFQWCFFSMFDIFLPSLMFLPSLLFLPFFKLCWRSNYSFYDYPYSTGFHFHFFCCRSSLVKGGWKILFSSAHRLPTLPFFNTLPAAAEDTANLRWLETSEFCKTLTAWNFGLTQHSQQSIEYWWEWLIYNKKRRYVCVNIFFFFSLGFMFRKWKTVSQFLDLAVGRHYTEQRTASLCYKMDSKGSVTFMSESLFSIQFSLLKSSA